MIDPEELAPAAVVGLDLSLTATGVATREGTSTLRTKLKGVERLDWFFRKIYALGKLSDVVVIEGYSYGSMAKREVMGELGGVARVALYESKCPFVVVAPTALKKYTTGKGNSGKDEIIAAAIRLHGFQGTNNNEADAYMLWRMGLARYMPGEHGPLKKYQEEGLAKVEWPPIWPESGADDPDVSTEQLSSLTKLAT